MAGVTRWRFSHMGIPKQKTQAKSGTSFLSCGHLMQMRGFICCCFCLPHWSAILVFRKPVNKVFAQMMLLCPVSMLLCPVSSSKVAHIDSPHASIRKARQVIIVNKKPIQWHTGSFSSKAEYHYSMNGSIIYSRAITCSDEAMLIG